ncbi:MAG: UDP-N-acetylmuramate dehydrogenase [Desulfotomaculales bacterium]
MAHESLQKQLAGPVRFAEPMWRHTTWRIGGPAEIFVEPASLEDLRAAIHYARQQGLPLTVIGNGSNVLVRDEGIPGLVVRIGPRLGGVTVRDHSVTAGAGTSLNRLVEAVREAGLAGLEFLAGIPGTVGGAVAVNAGAHGLAVGDRLSRVTVVDRAGNCHVKGPEELELAYRSSNVGTRGWIVVAAEFGLRDGDPSSIRRAMEEYLRKRRQTQPLDLPSAGSVFRNPPEGPPAGRLVEMAGGKGLRVGGAMVSPVHANFMVNTGGATARDVLTLIERVRELVYRRFGVYLALEVQVLGGGRGAGEEMCQDWSSKAAGASGEPSA